MKGTRLLLVEDDAAIRFAIRDFLETHGVVVTESDGCASGERSYLATRPQIVLSDYRLPDGNALDLLSRLKAINAAVPVVVLTAHGSVELAVEAMRAGADDFVTKPVALPALLVVIEHALQRQRDRQRQMVRDVRQKRIAVDPFIGTSSAIKKLQEQSERIKSSERPILILGETGAGKGVLTRWLHTNGPRAEETFVDLNCASLPRELLESELFGHERGAFTGAVSQKMGLVEMAHGGTLFLDEIGDLELSLQPKLLKVLEEQTFRRVGALRDRVVDVRLMAATHQQLQKLVAENKFRGDLYFRISTIPLNVPPLRERSEDIPLVASHLLDRVSSELGRGKIELTPDAIRSLTAYHWPGNIREMRNVLERATLLSNGNGVLRAEDLSYDSFRVQQPEGESGSGLTLDEVQRRHIVRVLEETGGHVERASHRLQIPRSTLYQKLKTMQIVVQKGSRAT